MRWFNHCASQPHFKSVLGEVKFTGAKAGHLCRASWESESAAVQGAPQKEQPKEQAKKEQPKKEQPKKEQPKKEQPKLRSLKFPWHCCKL